MRRGLDRTCKMPLNRSSTKICIRENKMKQVEIYTDGACSGNPGPGGWGAVLRYRFNGKVYEAQRR